MAHIQDSEFHNMARYDAGRYDGAHMHSTQGYQDNTQYQQPAGYPPQAQTYAQAQAYPLARAVNYVGGLMSLALVAGAIYWGYSLMARDVSGVPVVRAMDGPIRVQPEDPGGSQAAHQGLSVNQVAAEGGAEDPADQLILAPAPLDLTVEDDVMALLPETQPETQPAPAAAEPVAEPAQPEDIVQLASMDALVAHLQTRPQPTALPQVVKPAIARIRPKMAPAGRRTQVAIETQVAFANDLTQSLRPRTRPSDLAYPEGSYAGEADPTGDTAPIAAGTKMVWLGAFSSPEVARTEWGRLSTDFREFFAEKQQVIQKSDSGGNTFYRLRATGFADLADARRFCAVLVAEGAECIPETAR